MDDEYLELIKNVKVMFWVCPDGHSSHHHKDPPRETVRWIDGVAHCLTPGCKQTSLGTNV